MNKVYLAIDLGAESGRVMAGLWDGKRMRLEQVHRFPNGAVSINDTLRWNLLGLWAEIQNGLALAAKKYGKAIVSVGADTWGVDFVLLNKQDELLGLPYHYRDARTRGLMANTFRSVPRSKIFAESGLQFLEFNSLYQLIAWQKHSPELLDSAQTLLFMPDFFHWALCGAKKAEFTIASTSQFLHPGTGEWSSKFLKQLKLPTHFLPDVTQPGSVLGKLRNSLSERLGIAKVKVVAPASHDTASAVVGVPANRTGRPDWAYLSSGTWSLMGVETREANLSPEALSLNITNEGGFGGTYRLLKNIMGLWLVQGCKRVFEAKGETYTYAELAALAAKAKPFRSFVNPDDPRFLNPANMVEEIQSFCRETAQPVPSAIGDILRCVYESLALKYCEVLLSLETLTGVPIKTIHIVGGGSQNLLLNELTASACSRPVLAGPVEATALGNLLVQVKADRELRDLEEIAEVVKRSSDVKTFAPKASRWEDAVARYRCLSGATTR
jgi:rhamnulokinase